MQAGDDRRAGKDKNMITDCEMCQFAIGQRVTFVFDFDGLCLSCGRITIAKGDTLETEYIGVAPTVKGQKHQFRIIPDLPPCACGEHRTHLHKPCQSAAIQLFAHAANQRVETRA